MKTTLLVKSALAVGALAVASTAFAVVPKLSKATPVAGKFTGLPANATFSELVTVEVLEHTTGFIATVQTVWSGAASKQTTSFAGTLTGPGGFTQVLSLSVTPITTVILGHPTVIGGVELLTATDPTLAAGLYTLHISGLTKQVTTVSYNMSVTTPLIPVPEPETYAMMVAGLGAIGFLARRRKNA